MVDWQARLAREAPFFRALFDETGARRVLDVACGTGQHARMFASWGLEVVGTDASAKMIERARSQPSTVRWAVAGFLDVADAVDGPFDAVVCLGNSLPHLASIDQVPQALEGFRRLLRPGGVLIVQNRNADRMYAKGERLLGPSSRVADGVEHVFVRLYDLEASRMRLSIVALAKAGGRWTASVDSTELTPLFADELTETVARSGFAETRRYGGYDASSYVSLESDDLLLVAVAGP